MNDKVNQKVNNKVHDEVQKKIVRRTPQTTLTGADADALHPLLRRVLENRGVKSAAELSYASTHLLPPDEMKGVAIAAQIVHSALREDKRILIIGDYDVDGATATAVALLGLRAFGARNIDYLAANRFAYGYGLSQPVAEAALRDYQPQLVITVDNGISSVAGVAHLRAHNVEVIITDHHLPGEQLPQADAIVNPNQPGCNFASKALAGVGVLFYLLLAVRARLREADWFAARGLDDANLAALLDLVALGTVADLVPLDYNNRILVAQGIARVRGGKCRLGIAALLAVAGRGCAQVDVGDFGFIIGPRLNAAGRLADIAVGIQCLLAEDESTAHQCAAQLDAQNKLRRQLQTDMQCDAARIVAQVRQHSPRQLGLCVFDETWHKGVVGLVAARLAEKFNQPAVVFAPDAVDAPTLSGSARSAGGVHIRDVFADIKARAPQVILKFGGHAMAAGLTIARDQFARFAELFCAEVDGALNGATPTREIYSDGALNADELTIACAELLRDASPWGQAFPPPMFDGEFFVRRQRIVGGRHLKMTLESVHGSAPIGAILFGYLDEVEGDGDSNSNSDGDDDVGGDGNSDSKSAGKSNSNSDSKSAAKNKNFTQPQPPQLSRIHAAYQLSINEFRGTRSVELRLSHLRAV